LGLIADRKIEAVRIARKICIFFAALSNDLWAAFDVRDFFVLGGVGMLGYGTYLLKGQGWALVVCGPLLMAIGYLMGDK
jgi:hypothetical protein